MIDEKDKKLNEQSQQLSDDLKEFERLRGLIEKAFSIGWNVGVDQEPYDKKLRQFKTENNLDSLASPKQDEQDELWEELFTFIPTKIIYQDFIELKSKFTITRNPIK